jgi:hypothetical protein
MHLFHRFFGGMDGLMCKSTRHDSFNLYILILNYSFVDGGLELLLGGLFFKV